MPDQHKYAVCRPSKGTRFKRSVEVLKEELRGRWFPNLRAWVVDMTSRTDFENVNQVQVRIMCNAELVAMFYAGPDADLERAAAHAMGRKP